MFLKWIFASLALLVMTGSIVQAGDKNAVCKLLPAHVPANNVAYQAGVDAYGNAVVPADINAPPMTEALEVIKVPLNVDLAQRVAGLTGTGIQMEAPLGLLEIHQNGQIKYNGEDWTKPVMTLCGHSHKEVTIDIIEVEAPQAPIAPDFNEAAQIEKPVLPNNLAVTGAVEMPAVSAPIVEKVATQPKVSQPAEPIKPLIGTPKGTSKTKKSDIITGQDHRDYNE